MQISKTRRVRYDSCQKQFQKLNIYSHFKVVHYPKSFNTKVVLVNDIIRIDFRERCMLIDTSIKFGIQHLLPD